jgi:hypothetical protein
MSLTGGKRKENKSLKAWVTFVKKVQKEENISYKDAIHRAKVRKDKGEKWMSGGSEPTTTPDEDYNETEYDVDNDMQQGGRRRSRSRGRTMRKSRSRKMGRGRGRTMRKSRGSSRY